MATEHKIPKPQGTFYTDYYLGEGKLLAIFEHDCRKTVKEVCRTNKAKIKSITEDETHLLITL